MAGTDRCPAHSGINGRHTDLTEDVEARIFSAVSSGTVTLERALRAVGVPKSTYYDWLKRYPEFADRMEAAKDRGIVRNVTTISNAALKDWRAAAWLLERADPESYARSGLKDKVDANTDTAPTNEQGEKDPFEDLDELAHARVRRRA